MTKNNEQKVCLSIAGIDPSGGAGLLADMKTFAAFGCYGAGVTTSITFQNTQGVYGAIAQTAESVKNQISPIFDDFKVDAVKTGMLPTSEVIAEIAIFASQRGFKNLVVDPVVRATSGFDLIDDDALRTMIDLLFPLASIVTPNHVEAERIVGFPIRNLHEMERAAEKMIGYGARRVLIKGGHGFSEEPLKFATDRLFGSGENESFEAPFIDTKNTHGTGCALASAIAANLAIGKDFSNAVMIAKQFVSRAIETSPGIGNGNSPLNHLARQS